MSRLKNFLIRNFLCWKFFNVANDENFRMLKILLWWQFFNVQNFSIMKIFLSWKFFFVENFLSRKIFQGWKFSGSKTFKEKFFLHWKKKFRVEKSKLKVFLFDNFLSSKFFTVEMFGVGNFIFLIIFFFIHYPIKTAFDW